MRALIRIIVIFLIALSVAVFAHPGHEYRVEGVVSKVKGAFFDVEAKKGDATTFMVVPATEVFVRGSKAQASEIRVGVRARVEGVENDKGIVEAKIVRIDE